MALSVKAKKRFIVAMARRAEAQEILDAIELGTNAQAAVVAAIKPTVNLTAAAVTACTLTASAGVFVNNTEPTGTEVDTAITASQAKVKAVLDVKADNADVETLRTEVEARLDAIETKIDAVIASLVAATIMA